MQEPTERSPNIGNILELHAVDDAVVFRIVADTTFEDVVATLNYLEPDADTVKTYLNHMMRYVIEERGALKHDSLGIPDIADELTPQVRLERRLAFGPNPSFKDVVTAFTKVYGAENVPSLLHDLMGVLVKSGRFRGTSVRVQSRNEIVNIDDESIALEMLDLTERYGSSG